MLLAPTAAVSAERSRRRREKYSLQLVLWYLVSSCLVQHCHHEREAGSSTMCMCLYQAVIWHVRSPFACLLFLVTKLFWGFQVHALFSSSSHIWMYDFITLSISRKILWDVMKILLFIFWVSYHVVCCYQLVSPSTLAENGKYWRFAASWCCWCTSYLPVDINSFTRNYSLKSQQHF